MRACSRSCATPGLLRFEGYEASRRLSVLWTGMEAGTPLEAAERTAAEVRNLIAKAGFEAPEESFGWEMSRETSALDEFVDGVGQCASRPSA